MTKTLSPIALLLLTLLTAPAWAQNTAPSTTPNPPAATTPNTPDTTAPSSAAPSNTAPAASDQTATPAAPAPPPNPPAAKPTSAPPPPPDLETLTADDARDILGKKVSGAAGEDMGLVVDVLFDANKQPRAVVIDFGGFLGVGTRKIAVDWKLLQFLPADAKAPLKVALVRADVQAAPEYKEGDKTVSVVAGPAKTPPAATAAPDTPAAPPVTPAPSTPAPPASTTPTPSPPASTRPPPAPSSTPAGP